LSGKLRALPHCIAITSPLAIPVVLLGVLLSTTWLRGVQSG